MAISRISGNQIANTTSAIITTLKFLNTNSVFKLPVGSTAQRPTGIDVGTIRFNSTNDSAEIYKEDDGTGSPGLAALAGGGPSLGTDSIVRTNGNTISRANSAASLGRPYQTNLDEPQSQRKSR